MAENCFLFLPFLLMALLKKVFSLFDEESGIWIMKKKYCYGMLLAGLLFAVAGCGDQKQSAAPKTREQTKSKLKPKAGLTLEEALKQKFDVSPGWDAGKKCFIACSI